MGVMPAGPDARDLLASLVGMSISTVTGRPNAVIGVDDINVRVGTSRSPDGEMVPLEWVQNGIDLLSATGEVEVNPSTLGHRSSFVGAVLLTLPGAVVVGYSPPRIRLTGYLDPISTGAIKQTQGPSNGAGSASAAFGTEYREAQEDPSTSGRQPFVVDPARVERGLIGHASTQNALARALKKAGFKPRSPLFPEPNFDLAWQASGTTFVAEVKSITEGNEEIQLRLGLGQVLRYRQRLRKLGRERVVAVLVPERAPQDSSWEELCGELNVALLSDTGRAPMLTGDEC